jgi:hypothetical protein
MIKHTKLIEKTKLEKQSGYGKSSLPRNNSLKTIK